MENIAYTVKIIDKLRWNAHLQKHSHFEESKGARTRHVWIGIPNIIINVVIGSLLFTLIKAELPEFMKWIGAILALVAAVLGAMQTFFDFKANYEGHRSVGNQYLSIERECERLLALYFDEKLTLDHLSEQTRVLNERYEKVNAEAEKYIVGETAYKVALRTRNAKAETELSIVQVEAERIKTASSAFERDVE
jgi:hypothetical protein